MVILIASLIVAIKLRGKQVGKEASGGPRMNGITGKYVEQIARRTPEVDECANSRRVRTGPSHRDPGDQLFRLHVSS